MYHIRITDNDLTGFDRQGNLRVSFGKGMTQFTSPSIQLGPDDPGRIFCGNDQMNPLGRHIPSTIVSPQPTWRPTIPQITIAFTIIMAILAASEQLEDELDDKQTSYKSIKRTAFQVINFNDYLPEIR